MVDFTDALAYTGELRKAIKEARKIRRHDRTWWRLDPSREQALLDAISLVDMAKSGFDIEIAVIEQEAENLTKIIAEYPKGHEESKEGAGNIYSQFVKHRMKHRPSHIHPRDHMKTIAEEWRGKEGGSFKSVWRKTKDAFKLMPGAFIDTGNTYKKIQQETKNIPIVTDMFGFSSGMTSAIGHAMEGNKKQARKDLKTAVDPAINIAKAIASVPDPTKGKGKKRKQ